MVRPVWDTSQWAPAAPPPSPSTPPPSRTLSSSVSSSWSSELSSSLSSVSPWMNTSAIQALVTDTDEQPAYDDAAYQQSYQYQKRSIDEFAPIVHALHKGQEEYQ